MLLFKFWRFVINSIFLLGSYLRNSRFLFIYVRNRNFCLIKLSTYFRWGAWWWWRTRDRWWWRRKWRFNICLWLFWIILIFIFWLNRWRHNSNSVLNIITLFKFGIVVFYFFLFFCINCFSSKFEQSFDYK